MPFDIIMVGVLIAFSVVLFVTEALRVDLVALLMMAAVMVFGLTTPQEAFAGFSNPATITVAAMFVLSAGLDRTGTLIPLSDWITRLIETRGPRVSLLGLLVVTGFVSAIINNTAAVAIFLPAVMSATRQAKVSPSRFLLALSFVSMAGGTITLIGTSTNLLVNGIAEEHGLQGFSMFEFAPLGLILLAASLVYMLTLGYYLTPTRRQAQDLTEEFEMGGYLSALSVQPGGQTLGDAIQDSTLKSLNTDVLKFSRQNKEQTPAQEVVLEADDSIMVRTDEPEQLEKESKTLGLAVVSTPVTDRDLESSKVVLVEAGVGSGAEGSTLRAGDIKKSFDAVPLAVERRGRLEHRGLEDFPLKGGDTILFQVERNRLNQLRLSGSFLVLSQEEKSVQPRRALFSILVIVGVVLTAALGLAPIVVTATIGALLLVVRGCLSPDEAYRAIDWKVIFLLAGMLSLGSAMENTGAASTFANWVLDHMRELGPHAVLGCLYLLTTLMTAGMSNNATAALLTPVAISLAGTLEVDPRPFLVAVAFAASACFASPVGYQTNLMVYGPGRFKFSDFIKVGLPLNILFLVISIYVIPLIWTF
jgi:di/tricarboxylate transporter